MAQEHALRAFVASKIALLDADTPWARGMRAKLRRGAGKPPGEIAEIWEITLLDAPEEWNSREGEPSFEQQAIHAALTLYALHRQGKGGPMSAREGGSLGTAAGRLVKPDKSNFEAVKRRFDAIATSAMFRELAHYARGLVQQLKAEDILLDYPRFAEDLYFYQRPESTNRVRLRWGQDFYGAQYKAKDGEEGDAK